MRGLGTPVAATADDRQARLAMRMEWRATDSGNHAVVPHRYDTSETGRRVGRVLIMGCYLAC